ncbi:MAG: ABC transporter permease subunit [Burkholderiaceae bacterium]
MIAEPVRNRRALNWRSQAFRGVVYQILAILILAAVVGFLIHNTLANMSARGMQSGFGFLNQAAGFDIGETLIPYDSQNPYWKAFIVGLLNTVKVAAVGIVLATLIGCIVGVGRFARNPIVRGLCYVYIEVFRNVPVLIQLFLWYLVYTDTLPPVDEPLKWLDVMTLSKEGLTLGGFTASPEYLSLLTGLVLYSANYIAEIVRAGIASVSHGQIEAAWSIGLSTGQTMRRVLLPQALRVIVPPLTSQYLNLTKNSSLAVAIGYPDLISITNTSINQTGRAVECIAVTMAIYLSLSLATSMFMNWFNARAAIKER